MYTNKLKSFYSALCFMVSLLSLDIIYHVAYYTKNNTRNKTNDRMFKLVWPSISYYICYLAGNSWISPVLTVLCWFAWYVLRLTKGTVYSFLDYNQDELGDEDTFIHKWILSPKIIDESIQTDFPYCTAFIRLRSNLSK